MREQREILRDIQKIKFENSKICIFGCGAVGTGVGYDFLKFLDINIDYYCDNNSKLWGLEIRDKIRCISPQDLYKMDNVACFVFIGHIYQEEVISQLEEHIRGIMITHFELASLDIIVNQFLKKCNEQVLSLESSDKFIWKQDSLKLDRIKNTKNKKCVVYTCITGGYDEVTEPQCYSEDYDYYLISDEQPKETSIYQWIDIKRIVPDIVNRNPEKNRFCKILGPLIFGEYPYSVYVDGNVRIINEVESSIAQIGSSGIAVHLLPFQNCIYEHALLSSTSKRYEKDKIFKQVLEYCAAGMPRHYGMFECTILVRDNNNPICRQVMLDWWNEVFNHIYRDQLSFTYCLWKNGIKFEEVGVLGENHRKSNVFKMVTEHHTKIVNGKFKYIQ